MRTLIAGAGIGGMALGIALQREGHEPILLEQAPALGFVGQGIGIGANATKALRYLGAADRMLESAVPTRGWRYHGLEDGSEQLVIPIEDRYGEIYISTHRADLLDALVEQLDPANLRLGSRINEVEERPDGVAVVLDTGEEIRGDLLVGADGVKSVVRGHMVGDTDSRFSGFVAWRAALPNEAAPETARRRELRMWSGNSKFFVLYPIRENLVNVSAYVPTSAAEAESWSAGGDIDQLREVFVEACPEVRQALGALDSVLLTGIYVRDPLDHWVTDRIALIGDAAHSMGPFSGNGGGTAIEDAVTLGILLGGVKNAGEGAAALREYEQRRMPRMTRMMTDARARLSYLNDKDPLAPRARAGLWAGLRQLDPDSQLEYGWVYCHDPVQAARTPLNELGLDGTISLKRPEAQRAYDLWRGALTFLDHAGAWHGRRAGYERFASETFPPPADVTVREERLGDVPVLRVTLPGGGSGPTVLHLHGGGYMMGSARGSVELAARIARAVGGEVVLPDYRLAPEYGHPAALDDALATYRALVAADPGRSMILSGEDVGAALALGVAVAVRDGGDPTPAALFLVSPFVDLTVSAPSITTAGPREPWLDPPFVTNLAASYVQDADPRQPDVSPLFADLHGLPPMLICAAADEALIDDATRLSTEARAAGVSVELFSPEDSVHSFLLFDFLPESFEALERLEALAESVAVGAAQGAAGPPEDGA